MSLDNKLLWLRVFCIPTTTFIFTTNTIPLHRNKGRYSPTKASRLPKSYPSGKTDFSAPCPSLFVVLSVTWPNKHVNKVHLPSSCKGRGGPKLCSVASVPSIIDRIYKTIGMSVLQFSARPLYHSTYQNLYLSIKHRNTWCGLTLQASSYSFISVQQSGGMYLCLDWENETTMWCHRPRDSPGSLVTNSLTIS